jgi:hypothetical protein
MINQLRGIGDPLIRQFNSEHLQPVLDNSAYHSPEISETDEEDSSGKRKIVIKDLKWRSSTVSNVHSCLKLITINIYANQIFSQVSYVLTKLYRSDDF